MQPRQPKRAVRPVDEALVGGVCAAIARQYSLDVTLLRLVALLSVLAWGLGVVLYAALWLALPSDDAPVSPLRRMKGAGGVRHEVMDLLPHVRRGMDRGARYVAEHRPHWTGQIGRNTGAGLIALGTLTMLWSFGLFAWLSPLRIIGLATIGVGAASLVSLQGRTR